jgi:hypothetical protein
MNTKIQVSDYEIENNENMLNHYMHVCSPSKESSHEHDLDHDYHSHHHDHSDDHHDDDEHCYCCGHHEHHRNNDSDNEDLFNTHLGEDNCFGIHMHGNHLDRNHDDTPPCGMPQANMAYGMPLMIELEDDEDDKDDDKTDHLLKRIEKHNPEILSLMAMYGIAYPAAIKLLKRIIKATLHNK